MLRPSSPTAWALAVALALPAVAAAHGRDPHARTATANGWLSSLSAARKEAKKSNKPILAVLRCFD